MNQNSSDNTIITSQDYSDATTQRTIIDLIDAETGEHKCADMLDHMSEGELIKLKEVQNLAKRSGILKYVCAACGQPVRLDSRKYANRKNKSYFFSHYGDSSDCPIKTNSDAISPIMSTINWYGRFKESELHKNMCSTLIEVLQKDPRFNKEESYPTISIYGSDIHWHKPDVAADFHSIKIVFETLLYNSLFSCIVDKNSFYRMANSYLLWIFPHFSIEHQKMCEKDVYYTHRRNVFVFDSKDYYRTDESDLSKPIRPHFISDSYVYAQEESIKRGRLMLNCYWQVPVIIDGTVKIEWHHKLVGIEELTFDAIKKDIFFHNCDYDFYEVASEEKRKLISEWETSKEERWNKIFTEYKTREQQLALNNTKKEIKAKEKEIFERVINGDLVPTPFEENGKWGYKAEDVVIVKPQYKKTFPLRNGVAIAYKKLHAGVLDRFGHTILNFQFERITWADINSPFFLLAWNNKSATIYDVHGEKIHDFEILGLKKINDLLIIKKTSDEKYGLIDCNAVIIAEPVYDKIEVKDGAKCVLSLGRRRKTIDADINKIKTEVLLKIQPEKYIAEKLLLRGIVDAQGRELTPFVYCEISEQPIAGFIKVGKRVGKSVYYTLLDSDQRELFPAESCDFEELWNGHILRKGARMSVISEKGDVIYDNFSNIELCPNGNYIICKTEYVKSGWYSRTETKKYGLGDSKGNILFPCISKNKDKENDGNVSVSITNLPEGNTIRTCFGISALFDEQGNIINECIYDTIKLLPNGKLLVERNGKKGIIENNGTPYIACVHENILLDSEGHILTTSENLDDYSKKAIYLDKCALADSNGNLLTDFIFSDVQVLVEGYYAAITKNILNHSYSLINKDGKVLIDGTSCNELCLINNSVLLVKYGFFKNVLLGLFIIPEDIFVSPEYNSIEELPNGTFKVSKIVEGDVLFGQLDSKGQVMHNCLYKEFLTDSKGNVATIYETLDDACCRAKKFDKYALCDLTKKCLTDFCYESIDTLGGNYYRFVEENKQGVLNKNGKIILYHTEYSILKVFTDNLFYVQKSLYRGVLKHDGSMLIPAKFFSIEQLPNKTWKVSKGDMCPVKYGLYDEFGAELVPCIHHVLELDENGDIVTTYHNLENGYICATRLGKSALCTSNKALITDFQYDAIRVLRDTLFIVRVSSMEKVIDISGNAITDLVNYMILDFLDANHIIVFYYGKKGVVNSHGVPLIPIQYTDIKHLPNNTWKVEETSRGISSYGIFDYDGKCIIPCYYKSLDIDDNGDLIPSYEYLGKNNLIARRLDKCALCNLKKENLTDYLYDSISVFNENVFLVKTRDKEGLIDSKGNIIVDLSCYHIKEFINYDRVLITNSEHMGVVDSHGILIPIIYKDIKCLPNHYFLCTKNVLSYSKTWTFYEYLDENGKILYSSSREIQIDEQGFPVSQTIYEKNGVRVQKRLGKYRICRESTIFYDFTLDSVEVIEDAYIIIGKDKKFGLLNLKIEVILPMEYSSEFYLHNAGIIKFCTIEKKYGLCDQFGHILVEPKCSFIRENFPGKFKLFFSDGKSQRTGYFNIDNVKKQFVIGEKYTGTVSGIKEYGIFVKVDNYESGLVHIKKLNESGYNLDRFKIGDNIQVKVLSIRENGKAEFSILT